MFDQITTHPDMTTPFLAVDDWSNYIYILLIALSGLGALANKAIEHFGGKKGEKKDALPESKPRSGDGRKYPPLVTKNKTPRSTVELPPARVPPPQPLAPPIEPIRPRQRAPQTTARPVPPTMPAPPGPRPPVPAQRRKAARTRGDQKPATKPQPKPIRPKRSKQERLDPVPLSTPLTTTGDSLEYPTYAKPVSLYRLDDPAELRRAIVMREILGPPVALRDEDPWSI